MYSIPFIFLMFISVHGEFTSLPRQLNLVKTEATLKSMLDDYIYKQLQTLEELKRFSASFNVRVKNDQLDVDAKIGNPISAYALLVRLFECGNILLHLLDKKRKDEEILLKQVGLLDFPSEDDLTEILGLLLKLQRTYNLSSEDLASGKILGKKYNKMLSLRDSHQMGVYASETNYFPQAVDWLKLVKKKIKLPEGDAWLKNVNHYLIYSLYNLGGYEEGYQLVQEALQGDPSNADYLQFKTDYENAMANNSSDIPKNTTNQEETIFEEICRNGYPLQYNTKRLKCFYKFKNHFFLRIAPFKVETISYKPEMFLFHDVLSDYEISILKGLSLGKLQVVKEHRMFDTAASTFINEDNHRVLPMISQRVSDLSDLSTKFSEPFQVLNYAIGGYHHPHVDFFKEKYKEKFNLNDRTATVLFYLTDVEYGGATVFPRLESAISPKRGSALFWYNLDARGVGDSATLHGECPVLFGSKWMVKKWLNDLDQTFRRPCDVQKMSKKSANTKK